jgi:hypothetical protein
VADFVSELLAAIATAATGERERIVRQRFGGRHHYVSLCTGRGQVQQLIAYGVAARTARWKVRNR